MSEPLSNISFSAEPKTRTDTGTEGAAGTDAKSLPKESTEAFASQQERSYIGASL